LNSGPGRTGETDFFIPQPLLLNASPSPEKNPLKGALDTLEPPPVLGSWRRMYTVVLVVHGLLIMAFWLFGRYWAAA